MKKRLLSALLALALVFVLLPTTALAEEVSYGNDYDIAINGIKWKFEKNDSGEYIPVYYYANNKFSTDADDKIYKFYTNDNLMLTKKGDTVTISFRRGTSYQSDYYHQVKFTIESKAEGSDISCIEMGNGNNLVITGEGTKGTLILTRDGKDGIGAALSSKEGNITITGGATVKVTFKKQSTPNVSGHAISVEGHDLIISGEGTTVEATNQSGASRDFSNDATVWIKGGSLVVSGGAWLKATNEFSNTSKPYPSDFNNYSYFSCAISGDKDAPCTVSVTGENSCIIASAHNSTKYVNTSMGQAYRWANFKVDGAKIEVGTSSPAQTITDINKIKNYKYAKISVPALQRTPDVLIAGEKAVVGQWTTITADSCSGSYYYNADKKELTLKDVNITRNNNNVNHAIQFTKNGDYTINLEGANNISSVANGICALNKAFYDDPANISVTISGSGSLNVIANTYAIDMQVGNLIFNNTGDITLTTNTNYTVQKTVCNALHVAGSITIDNTKYDIVGARQEKDYPTETISDSSAFTPDLLNGYTVGETTTLFKTITITPAAAKPSTIRYNGTTLKQGETITGENGGTATVDSENNTITLKNFNGTAALSFDATLADSTLVLEGTNTLSSIVTTQKGLTISGSGSLTVGSIRVTNNDNISADLTITGGAHVTVNRPSEDKPAVEVSGNLTVTGEGTQLSAECTAATNPAIEVGGNVTISGNPGINAYTVKAYNKYATQRGRDDKLRPSQMPSAFEISGNLSISGSAQVMAQTDSDGAAVWMPKEKVISVADASLVAQNRSHNFSTISFGDESNMGNIYAKGQVNIVAENMLGSNSSLAHKAIKAFIYNHYNTGDSNPYYINVVSEGVQSGGNVNVIPGHCTSTGGYKVTITRGDAYTTPQVAANYTIAGQTMYVGKYYKTDANGNITEGTAQDYNIFCDSENDFTLNNATISSTGTGGSTGVIKTNLNYSSAQFHIKLIGTNSINNAGHHAILGEGEYSTIFIENAENASNASLTISGNFLPVYSFGNVTINAEVVIINTNGNLISTIKGGHANGAFDLGSGYKCYASTSTTGNPLEEFNSANYGTYKYLCVTTKTLETGGGSTHEHVWDEAWHDTGDYHHAHQCTICKAYDTTTQEPHNVTGHRDNLDGSHSNICGSCGYSAKVSHSYTWAPNANDNEKHIGTCVCGNVVERYHNFVGDVCSDCGYDKSTGTTCEHVWTTEWTIDTVDNEYHWHKCIKCNAITDKKPHAYTIVTDSGTNHIRECECKVFYVEDHISSDWIIDTPATATTAGSMHKECTVCKHKMQTEVIPATGEIEPPTPDNPGTIVIIRPAEEEKPAQQPNPSTGANDLVGLAVAAAVAAALGSAALLRKHD